MGSWSSSLFTVGQTEFPIIATSHQSPGGICSAGMAKRTSPQGKQREGPLEVDMQVGWKGRTPLPGSPSISQPVGSVCSLNSCGVCDSCEVMCSLSSCTVEATRPHSHCTDTNPTLQGGSIPRAEHRAALGRACSALCLHKPTQDVSLHTLSSPHSNT